MSIIGKIKELLFGASNAVDNKTKFSESYVLAAKQRAEPLVRELNESLNIANKSRSKRIREARLQIAQDRLTELKKLTIKFPFLSLPNLQAVEASFIAVEAETRALPSEVVDTTVKGVPDKARPDGSGQDRQHLSSSDEKVALLCIQSCFRVVNESIDIARKSQNLETKLSRLGVARDKLKEAQRQANRFSLKVDGFDAAEAEINRIDEAIKAGTPTEIDGMPHIGIDDPFASPSRDLLKEATALKKEKKYAEACNKLREAYSSEGSDSLMIEDRLRLPMYLQLAGNNDEGWDELNRLLSRYTDQFSQPRIEHQMKIFLRKENNETALNPVRSILRGTETLQEATSVASEITVSKVKNAPLVGKTIGQLQSEPMSAWGNSDIIKGLKFSATLQLRTPLRVLSRHGEMHTERTKQPPQIAHEGWEGVWIWNTKTWKELDIDLPERPPGMMASSIGPIPIDGGDYLPFLIAVRRIVELPVSIEIRIKHLLQEPMVGNWQIYVEKHGGIEKIIGYFFPRFINTIPKVPSAIVEELYTLGLNTPGRIAAATDETLLGIKGIGQAKLKAIRDYCAGVTVNRDADRIENVIR